MEEFKPIPIIDIFAGPGGLGEGFSSLLNEQGKRLFKIGLSIEKDKDAHKTLTLRSFYRQFEPGCAPEEYYNFLKGKITIAELYAKWPEKTELAKEEAWCATLGEPDEKDDNAVTDEEVDNRINLALNGETNWLLIGGPPCQAYSLVGRSRRKEVELDEEKDKRVDLYKEYLRILAVHNPSVFVMENVKGLLSAKTKKQTKLFTKILNDLSDPVNALISEEGYDGIELICPGYKIFSLTTEPLGFDFNGNPTYLPKNYVVKAEEYGIPQNRHRVILLGIRNDIQYQPQPLEKKEKVSLESVIGSFPKVRSGINRTFLYSEDIIKDGKLKKKRYYERLTDSFTKWNEITEEFRRHFHSHFHKDHYKAFQKNILPKEKGKEFIKLKDPTIADNHILNAWYIDKKLGGLIQHISRTHLTQDLKRYLFAALFTIKNNRFPKLDDYKLFDEELLPDHNNAKSGKFVDRFRVQLPNNPATTVTSHISKDGHYFIHYDPAQCRSLTVREAARIQTFPDNYFFCGSRTQQFHQVGNAVPPYLAYKIAQVVNKVFINITLDNLNPKHQEKLVNQ